MLIGFILMFFSMHLMKNYTEFSEPSVYLLFIPVIYIAEILNDYFQWWHTPVNLPEDRRVLRFVVLQSIFILLAVSLYYIASSSNAPLLSIHGFVSVCLMALGFKFFALELNHFIVKNFSSAKT